MKKAVDFLKQNKNALIVLVLLLVLIVIAVSLNGGSKSLLVSSTGANSQNKSVTELKLEQILSGIDGVGQAEVMINESEDGIDGVIIVCSGANNLMTRNNILNAVTTALNVKGNNIAIYAMNNNNK